MSLTVLQEYEEPEASSELESVIDAMARWRADPRVFVREVIGVVPDAWQDEVLWAVVSQQRIALKASKGPGKSTVLAWIAWWFLVCFSHPKIVATSITGDNLRDNLWTEMAKWQARSELLKQTFEWSAERIVARDHPETWWMSARAWPKSGNKEQQADTLAGIHADSVMFILDEAGGIPDAVAAAAEGGLANVDEAAGRIARLIIAGNPTHLEGPLYRACTRERALWWVKEISGDPDDPLRAPRVSLKWAQEQIEKYGRDNPYVLVNVFGKFPPGSSNALLGPDEVAVSMKRKLALSAYFQDVKILGVDVARFGDDRSVIYLRQGRVAFRPIVLRNVDTMQLAGRVALVINEHNPDAVFIDQATFGAGVVDRLIQLGYNVVGVDFGGKAPDARFHNMRASMWWGMADWIRAGGCLPDMPEMVTELTTPTYRFSAENRLQLEKKAEIKQRTGVSPDLADALALTFAMPVAPRSLRDQQGKAQRAVTEYDPFKGA